MKEKHFQRTSKLLFIVHTVSFIFLMIGLASQLTTSGLSPIISIVPMILNALCYFSSLVVKRIKHGNFEYIRFATYTFSVFYLVLICMAASSAAFPYMIPFLIIVMLTMEGRAVTVSTISFILSNIIAVAKTIATTENMQDSIESVMIEAIITIIVSVAILKGRKLLCYFVDESLGEVTDALKKNESVALQVATAANTVKTSADVMTGAMDDITRSTELMSETLQNIMVGTQSTAESITTQTIKTHEIQQIIDDTHGRTEAVVSATQDTTVALKEGMGVMDALGRQVEEGKKSNAQMQVSANALKANTDEVRGITDIIFSISSQTNLLALNASIEAARAGEAGRGFSVVADEIRKLAEQTRQETENIARIINALGENADAVSVCVAQSTASAEIEAQNVLDATEKFKFISEKLDGITADISEINKLAVQLMDSNNEIVDSVSNLSATSEEISASTAEASSNADNNAKLVNSFAEKLQGIVNEINELEAYIEK